MIYMTQKENNNGQKEEKRKVREFLSCSKCGSKYVYVLADGTIVCRRCSHRTPKYT